MAEDTKMYDEKIQDFGTRLDQRTKLSLMSAILLSTMEEPNIDLAVQTAFELDRKVGDLLRKIKNQRRSKTVYNNNNVVLTPERKEE